MRPALLALFVLAASHAVAAPRTVRLEPAGTAVAIRAYAIGMVPIDSRFTRFDGTLTYDPAAPGTCGATLRIIAASLETANPERRDMILGPDFLDADRFPELRFEGRCTGPDSLAGVLSLRGITQPLAMRLAWATRDVRAQGSMRRALWGMTAKPFIVGPTIRLSVAVSLP